MWRINSLEVMSKTSIYSVADRSTEVNSQLALACLIIPLCNSRGCWCSPLFLEYEFDGWRIVSICSLKCTWLLYLHGNRNRIWPYKSELIMQHNHFLIIFYVYGYLFNLTQNDLCELHAKAKSYYWPFNQKKEKI